MSHRIPPSRTLLSARARLHRHLPRLFSITDNIAIGDVNLNFDRTRDYTGTIHR
jgi:hypothetical protein